MPEKRAAARQQEEKKKAVIYLGPTIPGTAQHAAVYNNGLPPQLEKAVKEQPAIKRLLVPAEKAGKEREQLKDQSAAIAICYKKAEEYAAGKGKKG